MKVLSMKCKKYVACAAAMLIGSVAFAETNIDTTTSTLSLVGGFGSPQTATFGQTFKTHTTDTYLNSFSFFLNPLAIDFYAGVGTWDGAKIESIVYQSGLLNIGTSFTGYKEVQIFPGVQLAENKQYVAFFSTSGVQTNVGHNLWQVTLDSNYSDGEFVFLHSGNDPSLLLTQTWTHFLGQQHDLAFKANLVSAVPEPETYALMLAGLGVVSGIARRRKRKA